MAGRAEDVSVADGCSLSADRHTNLQLIPGASLRRGDGTRGVRRPDISMKNDRITCARSPIESNLLSLFHPTSLNQG